MSVTTVFLRLNDDTLRQWIKNRESFEEKDYQDCEAIEVGVEAMVAHDLIARANNKNLADVNKDRLNLILSGLKGESVNRDGDFPRVISSDDVAFASKAMDALRNDDLRRVYDIKRLKADYLEIEDWMWEKLGPNLLDDHLLQIFTEFKGFFRRAAAGSQKVVVYWY